MKKEEIARYMDHTLLKAQVDYPNVENLCAEAVRYNFASVAVFPRNIELCANLLKGTGVKIVAALAFPLGGFTPEMKAFEIKDAIARGGEVEVEADTVINVGAIKSNNWDIVKKELELMRKAAGNNIAKVILENCFLTKEEKIKACELAKEAGLDFVKTSTGIFDGATVEDVALMKKTVGDALEVKAAGGIRTPEEAKAMVEAGATRLGCSASVQIVENW